MPLLFIFHLKKSSGVRENSTGSSRDHGCWIFQWLEAEQSLTGEQRLPGLLRESSQHHPSHRELNVARAAVQERQRMLWGVFFGWPRCVPSLPSFSWLASCGLSGWCSWHSACAAPTAAGCKTPAAAARTWKNRKEKPIPPKCPILSSFVPSAPL